MASRIQADAAVAQDTAARKTQLLDGILVEEGGEGLDNDLLFAQQFIGKDTGDLIAVFDLHDNAFRKLGHLSGDLEDLMQADQPGSIRPGA